MLAALAKFMRDLPSLLARLEAAISEAREILAAIEAVKAAKGTGVQS